MNKSLFFGIGVLVVVGLVVFFRQSLPKDKFPRLLKKEVTIGTDVCREFPKEWVQSAVNKTIVKTEKIGSNGTNVCQYYTDKNNFVTLRLNNLNFENQKKGQQTLGRTITTNDKITLSHFIAVQDDGLINNIVLEINPNLFLAVDRTSTKAADETEIVNFAVKVAERIQKGENQGLVSITTNEPTKESAGNTVPLPQEVDIVNSFINLIDEGRPSDAVNMMSPKVINSDENKQAWAVMFNAFDSIKVIKLEPSIQSEWTDSTHSYKATLNVKMKSQAANAQPIPNYGWDNGENIRWINMEKINDKWTIQSFSTGP